MLPSRAVAVLRIDRSLARAAPGDAQRERPLFGRFRTPIGLIVERW